MRPGSLLLLGRLVNQAQRAGLIERQAERSSGYLQQQLPPGDFAFSPVVEFSVVEPIDRRPAQFLNSIQLLCPSLTQTRSAADFGSRWFRCRKIADDERQADSKS